MISERYLNTVCESRLFEEIGNRPGIDGYPENAVDLHRSPRYDLNPRDAMYRKYVSGLTK